MHLLHKRNRIGRSFLFDRGSTFQHIVLFEGNFTNATDRILFIIVLMKKF